DADAARGTVHLEVRTVRLEPGKERTVERQHGDVDRVHHKYRYVVTGRVTRLDAHPPTTTTYRFEDVEVGRKAALWLPGAGWGCGTVQTVTVTVTPPANSPVPVTVGAETIDGIPVWQVRTPIDDTSGKYVISGTLDDYISRVDFTKVRSTQSTTTSSLGHVTERDTSTTDYTRYGKSVHIQLPAACRRYKLQHQERGQRPGELADVQGGADGTTAADEVQHR
ncbi:MAG: hypothetical protein JOZ41_21035, partial [Chloroflexi bacterium]|nr:hypothetical protein [Chloroflexota bacterium]